MPVQLGDQGQADFSQPIELMMDCHRRIEHFLDVLIRVGDQYADRLLDPPGLNALDTALNYFHEAAPRHTDDEEQSLFPRMRQCPNPAAQKAMAEMDRLETDHRKAEQIHKRLDEIGRQWLIEKSIRPEIHTEFAALLQKLATSYQDHLKLEDEHVFTLASRLLDETALKQIGEEMRQRRRENLGRPGSRCAEHRRMNL